jgi:PDZ domain-containing protein
MAGAMRWHLLFMTLLAVTVGVSAFAALQPSGKGIIRPAGSFDVGQRLRLPDQQRHYAGRMAFTAVYESPATWADILQTRIINDSTLVPIEVVQPPNTTPEQINETNRRLIDESKPVAAVVALKAAGFPVTVEGEGVRVEGLVADMPAQGVLEQDDTILAVSGEPTLTVAALQAAINRHAPGEELDLRVRRGDDERDVPVQTKPSPSNPSLPMVGVYISTRGYKLELPFPVDVDTEGVGGPSAGLMFALGILDAVTDGDLTRGHFIAGTGTIDVDGKVGPIGAAREKVIGAERDGAEVFLVPRDNYEEARLGVRGATLLPVDRIGDAVRALCALPPAPGANQTESAVCRDGLAGGLD